MNFHFVDDRSIQLLSLRSNNISFSGVSVIVACLKTNKALQCIDLLRNPIEDASPISRLLMTSKTLSSVCGLWSHYRELLVRNPNLQTSDVDLIAADLMKSKDLAFLELRGSNNNLENIFVALESNSSLISLKIIDFEVSTEFTASLGACISRNRSLKTLSFAKLKTNDQMEMNAEKSRCMVRLLRSLEMNESITSLRIENLKFTREICGAIKSLLEVNTYILHLAFLHCEVDLSGFGTIAEGVQSNDTLRYVSA